MRTRIDEFSNANESILPRLHCQKPSKQLKPPFLEALQFWALKDDMLPVTQCASSTELADPFQPRILWPSG